MVFLGRQRPLVAFLCPTPKMYKNWPISALKTHQPPTHFSKSVARRLRNPKQMFVALFCSNKRATGRETGPIWALWHASQKGICDWGAPPFLLSGHLPYLQYYPEEGVGIVHSHCPGPSRSTRDQWGERRQSSGLWYPRALRAPGNLGTSRLLLPQMFLFHVFMYY